VTSCLQKYSDDELIEELARRRNDRKVTYRDVCHWCDDCGNFVPWKSSQEVPVNYNPCGKKHEVKFMYPEVDGDPHADHGFYRLVCADRMVIG
jgi:hypothetical protein